MASAVVKAVIQNEAAEKFGVWGQLGAAALTVATTQADLRGWQAMPDHWQATRFDRPDDGEITLVDSRGSRLGTVNIPDQRFSLVYVKRPTALAPATVITMDLRGEKEASITSLPEVPNAQESQVSSAN
jgi:hypothetical protein